MILLKEININDILILNKLIFKLKLPLYKKQTYFWCDDNFISFEFTTYVKPHNCVNSKMHILNKFILNSMIDYEPPIICTLDDELLLTYVVCDMNTFIENFYFLNKSHVDYMIKIKAFLLDFDDILFYNDCRNNIKCIKEFFNNYDYDAKFNLNNDEINNDEINNDEINNEPPAKKIFIGN